MSHKHYGVLNQRKRGSLFHSFFIRIAPNNIKCLLLLVLLRVIGYLWLLHYDDVIMSAIAFQITSLMIVYSIVYPGADQSKHQSSASLAFVWGIHRGPVNSPHKWPVTRKMFPFDDVIMFSQKDCNTELYPCLDMPLDASWLFTSFYENITRGNIELRQNQGKSKEREVLEKLDHPMLFSATCVDLEIKNWES